ncbi:GAF domain-containing protein [Sulfuricurvum sp. RIFCSPLOWO2_12_FULL_43_24]|uniref:GAF domain-containing protein n=1 Tax=Sulfuricurvum sp. RIFCSPLOWO2_12_FULL_43_24 TaxID=1802247 RepID=UPI0008B851F2|nr:GAF domain-containing protein [Sulfuricurvum sp. RIFCSPLOWO2_12_FULL_43_24]OHD87163.1 MAG: guanylate cyclase [Sulfuricurvum sp. RIFCSPLOWO2_02_43_6]OHD91020.1 MAG: guanylate cyclase [Sulfuricurvum sp. RIFCSPLOWO2_12_FULL_43_24]
MSLKIYERIADFGKRLSHLNHIEETLPSISEEAKAIVSAERCSIFIVDQSGGMLWTKLSDGIGRIAIGIDSGIVGDTVHKKIAQLVNNPYEDSRFLAKIDEKSGFVTRNILAVPIFNSRQEVIGVIQLLNKYHGDFTENDEGIMSFFANYISGTLELALLMEKK